MTNIGLEQLIYGTNEIINSPYNIIIIKRNYFFFFFFISFKIIMHLLQINVMSKTIHYYPWTIHRKTKRIEEKLTEFGTTVFLRTIFCRRLRLWIVIKIFTKNFIGSFSVYIAFPCIIICISQCIWIKEWKKKSFNK